MSGAARGNVLRHRVRVDPGSERGEKVARLTGSARLRQYRRQRFNDPNNELLICGCKSREETFNGLGLIRMTATRFRQEYFDFTPEQLGKSVELRDAGARDSAFDAGIRFPADIQMH